MTEQVEIDDAKTQVSKLIDRALAGEHVTIARAGHPLVDLVPTVDLLVVIGGLKHAITYDESLFDAADKEIAEMSDADVRP